MQSYINNENFVVMLTDLRSMYDNSLKQTQPQNYSRFSKIGTLASVLEEVYTVSKRYLYIVP